MYMVIVTRSIAPSYLCIQRSKLLLQVFDHLSLQGDVAELLDSIQLVFVKTSTLIHTVFQLC